MDRWTEIYDELCRNCSDNPNSCGCSPETCLMAQSEAEDYEERQRRDQAYEAAKQRVIDSTCGDCPWAETCDIDENKCREVQEAIDEQLDDWHSNWLEANQE